MGFDVTLSRILARGDGYAVVPFGFQINGVTTPDNLIGGTLSAAARTAAGKFTCTLDSQLGKPVACYGIVANASVVADATNLYTRADWSNLTTNGTFVVRTMAAGTETDPADNTLIAGFILVKLTDRAI